VHYNTLESSSLNTEGCFTLNIIGDELLLNFGAEFQR